MGNTPCKECVFAEYKGITQIGCSRNMVNKFREIGAEVMEAYDEDKEFYVIKNRHCNSYRTSGWIDRLGLEVTEEEIEATLKRENKIAVHVIILTKENDLAIDVYKTTSSFSSSSLKPIQVTVIRHPKAKITASELNVLFEFEDFKWRMENLLFSGNEYDPTRLIHNSQKTCSSQYYSPCFAGYRYPDKFLDKINTAITEDLIQFGLIEVEENSEEGYLIPNHVHSHWYFNGNPEDTISENIREYQCQNPTEKVIYNINHLPS